MGDCALGKNSGPSSTAFTELMSIEGVSVVLLYALDLNLI